MKGTGRVGGQHSSGTLFQAEQSEPTLPCNMHDALQRIGRTGQVQDVQQ